MVPAKIEQNIEAVKEAYEQAKVFEVECDSDIRP
jgi:Pyruvate/2-oxoacid:ferredoxin oxidoreductase gamma subunit